MSTVLRWTSAVIVLVGLIASDCLVPRHTTADDWLPIPPEDLALKDNPASPGANAMILYRRSHVDSKRSNLNGDFDEEYVRVKIFTEQGAKEEGDIEIPYDKDDSDVVDIRARTIRPDGSIVNFNGKVFEKTVERGGGNTYLAKVFTLTDVKPGCIIEHKYRLQFKKADLVHVLHGRRWIVSSDIFTRDASFSIIPYVGGSEFAPTLFFRTTGLPAGSLPQRRGDGTYSMELHNIPGVQKEPLMPPIRSLEARVDFFYRAKGEPAGETTEQFWNRMGRQWSAELDNFVNKPGALEQDLSRTVAANDPPEIKLQKIFARVQKIRDLSYEPAMTEAERKQANVKPIENVEEVLQRGYANGRQINWLFVGLARTAGFDADSVYIVPRDKDVFKPAAQDAGQVDDDIIWVRAGGKEYWLDPAALYYPLGLLPWYETETKGIRASKQGAEFIETPALASTDAVIVRTADLALKPDGSATGKLQVDFRGLEGATARTRFRRDDEAGRKKGLEREVREWLPSGSAFEVTSLVNWDDANQALHFEGNVSVTSFGAVSGHRLLVPMTLFRTDHANTFRREQRVNPVQFRNRYEEIDTVTTHAPDGYKIETAPRGATFNSGSAVAYEIVPTAHGDSLEVKRHFALTGIRFGTDWYAALRSVFGMVQTDDQGQVILQSADTAQSK